jgi:hypothetical protein
LLGTHKPEAEIRQFKKFKKIEQIVMQLFSAYRLANGDALIWLLPAFDYLRFYSRDTLVCLVF